MKDYLLLLHVTLIIVCVLLLEQLPYMLHLIGVISVPYQIANCKSQVRRHEASLNFSITML